jgi:agmatinase
MQFPNYFADAEASFDESDFIIFGVPYDKTSSFRKGASKAPDKIREASWNFETFNLFTGKDIADLKIHDYGNLDVEKLKPTDMTEKVTNFVKKILDKNKFPIAIGGEHSITPGIIRAYPKDIAVIALDAHIDFRKKYENDSNNHACVIRRISDHINIKNIAVLGIRSAEKAEFIEEKKKGLFFINSFDIKKEGIEKYLEKTKKYLKDKPIYLTLDIDVVDPSFAPGTSTPEPFGLSDIDILKCIDFFSKYLIGFDIVEVCPAYDNGQSSLLAAKYIRNLIEKISFKDG